MGLDMYLIKKTYVWSDKRKDVSITGIDGVRTERVSEITEQIGYWRKANAIHQWIVENVQGGEDNCEEYEFDREKMQELLTIINKVLKASKLVKGKINNGYTFKDGKKEFFVVDGKFIKDPKVAMKLLPTTEGFFFGSTDYDEYYYKDLTDTKAILEQALSESDKDSFYYRSSW